MNRKQSKVAINWSNVLSDSNDGFHNIERLMALYQWLIRTATVNGCMQNSRYREQDGYSAYSLLSPDWHGGINYTHISPLCVMAPLDWSQQLHRCFVQVLCYPYHYPWLDRWRDDYKLHMHNRPRPRLRLSKQGCSHREVDTICQYVGRTFRKSHNSYHPAAKMICGVKFYTKPDHFGIALHYDIPFGDSSWNVVFSSNKYQPFGDFVRDAIAYFDGMLEPVADTRLCYRTFMIVERLKQQFGEMAPEFRWDNSKDLRAQALWRIELARLLAGEHTEIHSRSLVSLTRGLRTIAKRYNPQYVPFRGQCE